MDLGEQIELVDFLEEEPGELVIVKKIVGHAVKHFTERLQHFERLTITFKHVHGSHHEVHGKLAYNGAEVFTTVTDQNKFFALDACLKKLGSQASH